MMRSVVTMLGLGQFRVDNHLEVSETSGTAQANTDSRKQFPRHMCTTSCCKPWVARPTANAQSALVNGDGILILPFQPSGETPTT